MKFALVGNGFIAPRHIEAIKHIGGEIAFICDVDSSRAIPGIPFCKYYKFMSGWPDWKDIDVISICTPNHEHVEMAEWFLNQGKRVICEKPLALSTKELNRVLNKDISTVLQLRHHPVMDELRMRKPKKVWLYVKVKRGPEYWSGWKGDNTKSGGIVVNLGVHYFDALLELYGYDYKIMEAETRPRLATGLIKFKNGPDVRFRIEISATSDGCDRYIQVDDEFFRFSNKENLSMEDLHKAVYSDFFEGRGIKPKDLVPLTKLMDILKP